MTPPSLIEVLARWEDANGSLAAIFENEWIELLPHIAEAACVQSPRQIRAAIEADT